MSDIDTSTESTDTPLSWPTAEEVVPDDQVTTEPEPEGAEDEAVETPAPEAPAAEETPAEEPAAPAADGQQTFDRAYVEGLRQEAAGYRVRAKQYEDVFGQYNDVERDKFLDLAAGLADEARHQEVATEFINIGKRILEHYGVEVGDLAAPDPNRPMTRAEYEAAERQRKADADLERDMERITAKVQGLGYELGSLDHYALLRAAQEQEGTVDWDVAHAKVKAWKDGLINDFIKEHSKKAGAHLPTPPATGAAPAEMPEELPADQAEALALARKQFNAMLDGS